MMTLVLGGARSGKSRYAQSLCGQRPVVLVATARRHEDDELEERIRKHRAARPPHWSTLEEPLAVVDAIRQTMPQTTVVLDCVTVWLSNLMWECRSLADVELDRVVLEAADGLAATARDRDLIVVSNEVGSGVVPAHQVARRFRDLQGFVNQRLAAAANRVVLMVAGIPVTLVGTA